MRAGRAAGDSAARRRSCARDGGAAKAPSPAAGTKVGGDGVRERQTRARRRPSASCASCVLV